MERHSEKLWKAFCGETVRKLLKKLKSQDYAYKEMMVEYANLECRLKNIASNSEQELTNEYINKIDRYIMLVHQKEEIEREAIYAKGMLDCFGLLEKYK